MLSPNSVAVQERPAAVRLHEQFDRRLPFAPRCRRFWRRCTPFRRDSPGRSARRTRRRARRRRRSARPARPTRRCTSSRVAIGRAVRAAEASPGNACWPSSAASCRRRWRRARRGRGSGRDRRSSARRRAAASSRFSAGTRKSRKMMPVVVRVLERVQAVFAELKMLVLLGAAVRRSARPACRRSGTPGRSSGRARRW